MKLIKFSILFFLVIAFGASVATAQKNRKLSRKPVAFKKTTIKSTADKTFKVLHENMQSSVEEPFVFVARNKEAYAELQKKVENLPASNSIDFKTTAVIAAFAGTKPTPGYKIVFTKTASGVKVELASPSPDAVYAQVLTSPVKVVAVPVEEGKDLKVELDANWQNKVNVYRVAASEFEMSGGFAGISKKFELTGTVGFMRSGEMATALFNLSGKGSEKARKLVEIASGKINRNEIILTAVESGSLVDLPRPALLVKGTMTGKNLSLSFEPLPTNVSDGFEGRGKLEAIR